MVNPLQYQRAAAAWPVLTETAANESKITYVKLAQHLGIHPRPIRFVLGVIQDHCLREKLPPLTILSVNQRGVPGEGFIAWDVDDLTEGYRLVYQYPWHELANPFGFAEAGTTLNQLAERLVTTPADSTAVYGRINNRSIAQIVFRLALLSAYQRRCAFCGLSLVPALEAAHIIGWSEATIAQRLDPRNGLLLCATHHALFDAHILTVDADRRIIFQHHSSVTERWTQADKDTATSLDGKHISMPVDPNLRPSAEVLQHRAAALTKKS